LSAEYRQKQQNLLVEYNDRLTAEITRKIYHFLII